MAEFVDCAAVALTFFAIIAVALGYRDEALELGALGAVAVGLALGRRWWKR